MGNRERDFFPSTVYCCIAHVLNIFSAVTQISEHASVSIRSLYYIHTPSDTHSPLLPRKRGNSEKLFRINLAAGEKGKKGGNVIFLQAGTSSFSLRVAKNANAAAAIDLIFGIHMRVVSERRRCGSRTRNTNTHTSKVGEGRNERAREAGRPSSPMK